MEKIRKKNIIITAKYIVKNSTEIRILGDIFVKNNKSAKIYINGKKHDIVAFLKLKDGYIKNNELIIDIKLDKIKNLSYMFC